MDNESSKLPMEIEVSRALLNMGINFSFLERISRGKWCITCPNKEAANNAISNKYVLESKYNVNIPWYMVYRKVVIKDIPGNFSNEDIGLN